MFLNHQRIPKIDISTLMTSLETSLVHLLHTYYHINHNNRVDICFIINAQTKPSKKRMKSKKWLKSS